MKKHFSAFLLTFILYSLGWAPPAASTASNIAYQDSEVRFTVITDGWMLIDDSHNLLFDNSDWSWAMKYRHAGIDYIEKQRLNDVDRQWFLQSIGWK